MKQWNEDYYCKNNDCPASTSTVNFDRHDKNDQNDQKQVKGDHFAWICSQSIALVQKYMLLDQINIKTCIMLLPDD